MVNEASLSGRNLFHVRYISLSYRIRGSVHRIHTNSVANNIVLIIRDELVIKWMCVSWPVNSVADNSLMNRIFIYSAMKIMANSPLLYSVLNPETSSDSPSAKSNGVRFVSAKFVINHEIIIGVIIIISHDFMLMFIEFISIV
jgi:hypothetical protein